MADGSARNAPGNAGAAPASGESDSFQMALEDGTARRQQRLAAEVPANLQAFQILLHLQYLRGQLHHWSAGSDLAGVGVREVAEVLSTLGVLAAAANEAGFVAYAQLCQRVSQQFEQLCPKGSLRSEPAQLLANWTHRADRYLRKPSSRSRIAALVSQLGTAAWPTPLPPREQDRFIQEMLLQFA